jgi:phosphoglycerol transferase MdoB-like AlkP superfamily enzyme
MVFPWFDVIVSVIFLIATASAIASGGPWGYVISFAVMSLISAGANYYALTLDQQSRRLTFWAGIQSLFYAHVLSFTTIRAGLAYIFKREARWDKLERSGGNVLPD